MNILRTSRMLAAMALLLECCPAQAHSFGRTYNLPVPFWLYAWGAAAALVASFLVCGYFMAAATAARAAGSGSSRTLNRPALLALQLIGLAGLLLCIATGLLGTRSAYENFNMTFFWIVFVLGFTYATALLGDLYALANPWQLLATGLGRVSHAYAAGLLRYPTALGYWPALAFYMAFIWIELFGRSEPSSLAMMLAAYSLLNLLGAGLIGIRDWFRYCEFFSVFFRLVALMAPVAVQSARPVAQLQLRAPFSGLIQVPADNLGLLVFVLFMLSSTAFDGLRETLLWHRLFWVELYHAGLRDIAGANPLAAFPAMNRWFLWWQTFWLLASPFLYLGIYLAAIEAMRRITGCRHSLRQLALEFAFTLLPIALVYNITHYYTLILTQGVKIVSLASDPFGRGWNLFGTAGWLRYTIVPDIGTVWHVQVALIVAGHIVSVYLAHRVALRLFPGRWLAVLSQLPMLLLMVLFTAAGLWILALPLQPG